MYRIPVERIPNQIFTITIDNVIYRVALRTIQELTYMSLWAVPHDK